MPVLFDVCTQQAAFDTETPTSLSQDYKSPFAAFADILDNAADAGARNVSLTVERLEKDGGRHAELVRVQDDGSGALPAAVYKSMLALGETLGPLVAQGACCTPFHALLFHEIAARRAEPRHPGAHCIPSIHFLPLQSHQV